MENKNIMLADFGMNVSHVNVQDLIFNVYKGFINKLVINEFVYDETDGTTADEIDSMGVTCNPTSWARFVDNGEVVYSISATLNKGFVWGKSSIGWKEDWRETRFGGFTLEEALNNLAEGLKQVQFRDDFCKEDWTDIVYLHQKSVYGNEAYITKENRFAIANEFYGEEVHKYVTATDFPIRTINNPLSVIPTIEYKMRERNMMEMNGDNDF